MKKLSNVIGSGAARFVSLRVALVLCAVMALAGLGAAHAWQHGFQWMSTRKASAQSHAASAPDVAGQAQESVITIGKSYDNDTSLRLRDVEQVHMKSNELESGQSTKAQETVTARDTGPALFMAGIFPDTDGEVGATQRVKIVKRSYQIFDNRTGASVLGPSDISKIWAGFGGSCETGGAGDAVVLYDKDADRWVFSRFASATSGQAATEECFAVSTTSDATGSYYRYAFHLGGTVIDSPHLTAQSDGYLMGDSIYNESGTQRLGTQFFLFDRTAMLAGSAATVTSPGLDTGVGETYSISTEGVSLASKPIEPAVSTLTINLTYASDATFTAAGLSAADIVNMKAANTYAASQFTSNYSDPINVNIFVTAVPGTGTLGGSSTSIFIQPFTTGIRDPTRADATSTDDATMAGAGGSVPTGLADPIGGTHNWWVSKAQRKALRIAADDLTSDGTYTFGGGFSYTYDPNNRAVAGKIDYIGVSMHEFSEIMGRIGGLGATISGSPAYLQMDLFHYIAANTRGLTNGAGRSFSFNNGTTLLKAFNNAALNGGDAQDWASGTNDTFNAFSSSGVRNDLTAVDLQVMDVIGYDKASNPPPPAPTATAATNVTSSSFTANWTSSSGATGYRLDVSTSSSFGSFVSGYQNLDVGNVLNRSVTGLSAATTYFYRVRAYNGGGTSGDSNIISVTTSGGGLPDLVVTALTAPTTGAIGGQITVATTVVNQGSAAAGAFRVGFYLSTDNIITTGDTFTGWGCTYPSGLAAGASTSCDGPVGIPSSLPPGTYYFGAIADDLGAVAESNEANNSRAADTGPIVLTSQGQGTCASPYNIVRGHPFNGNTSGGQSVFASYSCVGWSESGPERVHTITMASSGTLTASLSNLGGNDLDVFILSSCSSGSCLAFGDNTASANVGPGTYYILVDGFEGAVGGYTLTVGNTAFDFDGDGKSDVCVFRPSTGTWFIINSSTGLPTIVGWGQNGDKPVAGDYDGDGKTDIAIWRPSTGAWWIRNSSNGSTTTVGWGVSSDVPVPADYDGDGKTDMAVWRPATGTWFIINSSTGSPTTVVWGASGDKVAPADYDGDGKADVAVFRPSTGTWFIINSSNGSTTNVGWGQSGDIPVAADYDGDGKADIAIWRPSTGVWWIRKSSNGSTSTVGWGISTDVPVPADYDGDGKSDNAVWRSGAVWLILNSSNGSSTTVVWGAVGDIPISAKS